MVSHHLLTPYLPIDSLPESERPAANLLQNSLYNLESYVEDLHSARVLFDFAVRKLPPFSEPSRSSDHEAVRHWPFIACRDGAITLFNFAKSLDAIRGARRNVPSLPTFDSNKLKAAWKEFRTHFPSFEAIRHGVAHAAELMKDVPSYNRNVSSKSSAQDSVFFPSGILVQNAIVGRRFSLTIDGELVSYELSEASVFNLARVRTTVFDAFPFSRLEGYGPPLDRVPPAVG